MWRVHQLELHMMYIALIEVPTPCAGLLRLMCECAITIFVFICFCFFKKCTTVQPVSCDEECIVFAKRTKLVYLSANRKVCKCDQGGAWEKGYIVGQRFTLFAVAKHM